MLCCAALCCAVLCRVVLCRAVLCRDVLDRLPPPPKPVPPPVRRLGLCWCRRQRCCSAEPPPAACKAAPAACKPVAVGGGGARTRDRWAAGQPIALPGQEVGRGPRGGLGAPSQGGADRSRAVLCAAGMAAAPAGDGWQPTASMVARLFGSREWISCVICSGVKGAAAGAGWGTGTGTGAGTGTGWGKGAVGGGGTGAGAAAAGAGPGPGAGAAAGAGAGLTLMLRGWAPWTCSVSSLRIESGARQQVHFMPCAQCHTNAAAGARPAPRCQPAGAQAVLRTHISPLHAPRRSAATATRGGRQITTAGYGPRRRRDQGGPRTTQRRSTRTSARR